jgi:hypothetical protein
MYKSTVSSGRMDQWVVHEVMEPGSLRNRVLMLCQYKY